MVGAACVMYKTLETKLRRYNHVEQTEGNICIRIIVIVEVYEHHTQKQVS